MIGMSLLSDEFAAAAAAAGLRARGEALAEGHPVVYLDEAGRFIQELPDGTLLEIRFRPGAPRESHIEISRKLGHAAR